MEQAKLESLWPKRLADVWTNTVMYREVLQSLRQKQYTDTYMYVYQRMYFVGIIYNMLTA